MTEATQQKSLIGKLDAVVMAMYLALLGSATVQKPLTAPVVHSTIVQMVANVESRLISTVRPQEVEPTPEYLAMVEATLNLLVEHKFLFGTYPTEYFQLNMAKTYSTDNVLSTMHWHTRIISVAMYENGLTDVGNVSASALSDLLSLLMTVEDIDKLFMQVALNILGAELLDKAIRGEVTETETNSVG